MLMNQPPPLEEGSHAACQPARVGPRRGMRAGLACWRSEAAGFSRETEESRTVHSSSVRPTARPGAAPARSCGTAFALLLVVGICAVARDGAARRETDSRRIRARKEDEP